MTGVIIHSENHLTFKFSVLGDIGHVKENDCFVISDRLKELIKYKGLQVQCYFVANSMWNETNLESQLHICILQSTYFNTSVNGQLLFIKMKQFL